MSLVYALKELKWARRLGNPARIAMWTNEVIRQGAMKLRAGRRY